MISCCSRSCSVARAMLADHQPLVRDSPAKYMERRRDTTPTYGNNARIPQGILIGAVDGGFLEEEA
jgi:hypothetical protein